MSDLLAEVDDAMRQERMEKLWKDHGKKFIAAFILIIVLTAAVSFYKKWDAGVRQEDTARLIALLNDPAFPGNIEQADLDMRAGLRGVALITAAGAYVAQDEEEKAEALYAKAAGDNSMPGDLRQMAVIMQTRLAEPEEQAQTSLEALQKIADDASSPWRYHARLEAAAIYAHRNQDFDRALAEIQPVLEAKDAPQSVRGQAEILHHIYSVKKSGKSS